MKIHKDIQQGSVDWSILRSGKVTASELDNLLTPEFKIRTGQMPKTYLNQKLAERWLGGPLPAIQGVWDLDQGAILEEYGIPAFTVETGLEVERIGFIETDDGRFGCSPDGIIGSDIGLELKCPHIENHIGYILNGNLPKQYAAQVYGSLFASGFSRWMFCSFRRNFPPLVVTVEPDQEIFKQIALAMDEFTKDFDSAYARLVEINGGPPKRLTPPPAPQPQPEYVDIIP